MIPPLVIWKEGNPLAITLTMDDDKNVTATFRPLIVPEVVSTSFDPVSRSVSLTWPSYSDAIYRSAPTWRHFGSNTVIASAVPIQREV